MIMSRDGISIVALQDDEDSNATTDDDISHQEHQAAVVRTTGQHDAAVVPKKMKLEAAGLCAHQLHNDDVQTFLVEHETSYHHEDNTTSRGGSSSCSEEESFHQVVYETESHYDSSAASVSEDDDDESKEDEEDDIIADNHVVGHHSFPPSLVMRKIEDQVSHYLKALKRGSVPDMSLIRRTASNADLIMVGSNDDTTIAAGKDDPSRRPSQQHFADEGGEQEGGEKNYGNNNNTATESGASFQNHQFRLSLDDKKFKRKLALHSSRGFCKVWIILQAAYRLLSEGKTVTQRELYYLFASSFKTQMECNNAILDCTALLQVPRHSLGIVASVRGYFSGTIKINDNGTWVDCESASGRPITSDILFNKFEFQSNARFIIVIEKDGIFARLCEDRFFESIPSILVTGKGVPDLATRALVHTLAQRLQIPVLGLCDWNPFGLALLLTYKLGSIRMGIESTRYAVDIKWVGLRGTQVSGLHLPTAAFQKFTKTDDRKTRSLQKNAFIQRHPLYRREVELMAESATKVELEALHTLGFRYLAEEFLERCILRKDYF